MPATLGLPTCLHVVENGVSRESMLFKARGQLQKNGGGGGEILLVRGLSHFSTRYTRWHIIEQRIYVEFW